jgi:hypothetical protein
MRTSLTRATFVLLLAVVAIAWSHGPSDAITYTYTGVCTTECAEVGLTAGGAVSGTISFLDAVLVPGSPYPPRPASRSSSAAWSSPRRRPIVSASSPSRCRLSRRCRPPRSSRPTSRRSWPSCTWARIPSRPRPPPMASSLRPPGSGLGLRTATATTPSAISSSPGATPPRARARGPWPPSPFPCRPPCPCW